MAAVKCRRAARIVGRRAAVSHLRWLPLPSLSKAQCAQRKVANADRGTYDPCDCFTVSMVDEGGQPTRIPGRRVARSCSRGFLVFSAFSTAAGIGTNVRSDQIQSHGGNNDGLYILAQLGFLVALAAWGLSAVAKSVDTLGFDRLPAYHRYGNLLGFLIGMYVAVTETVAIVGGNGLIQVVKYGNMTDFEGNFIAASTFVILVLSICFQVINHDLVKMLRSGAAPVAVPEPTPVTVSHVPESPVVQDPVLRVVDDLIDRRLKEHLAGLEAAGRRWDLKVTAWSLALSLPIGIAAGYLVAVILA